MNKVFKNIHSAILAITCFAMITILSCGNNSNDCLCTIHGVCKNGTCVCQLGYAGAQCQTLIRSQYTGVWLCGQACSGAGSLALANPNSFTISIDSSTQSPAIVQISSFSTKYNTTLLSTVTLDSMIIAPQIMPDGDTLQGWANYKQTGSIYGQHGDLTLNIIITNHGLADTCIISGNK